MVAQCAPLYASSLEDCSPHLHVLRLENVTRYSPLSFSDCQFAGPRVVDNESGQISSVALVHCEEDRTEQEDTAHLAGENAPRRPQRPQLK